ncbi:eCIS core domain-containing protein [Calothrix rhizosoleniae]|uniref:eCIS core domain-containing protein n=1 Tax=Calothrix rhizosoleniae TaxID=888997 RepID=UPI000B4A46ED|nr:DUF4157 domain-containing protein [Calothrix rhizosoleniae]
MSKQTVAQQTPTTSPLSQGGILQRKCETCGQHTIAGGECEECKKKAGIIQRRAANHNESSEVPPIVHEVLQSPGQPLDRDTRSFMESRFGHDFSQVRVHTDTKAGESAQAVNALAYTVGHNIIFGKGQYAPESPQNRYLLGHELTHVVQQRSVNYSSQTDINFGAEHDGFEQQAERNAQTLKSNRLISSVGSVLATPMLQRVSAWQRFIRFIGFEGTFDDQELQDYLTFLDDNNRIEDRFDSDNKARAIVRRWMGGATGYTLSPQRKILLIEEMLSGPTGNADEEAILNLIAGSPDSELTTIFSQVSPQTIRDDVHGKERRQLDQLITAYEARTRPLLRRDIFSGTHAVTPTEHAVVESILTPGATLVQPPPPTPGAALPPPVVQGPPAMTGLPPSPGTPGTFENDMVATLSSYLNTQATQFRALQAAGPPAFPISQANSIALSAQNVTEQYFAPYIRTASRTPSGEYHPAVYSLASMIRDQSTVPITDAGTAAAPGVTPRPGRIGWVGYWMKQDFSGGEAVMNRYNCVPSSRLSPDGIEFARVRNRFATDPANRADIDDTIHSWPAEATGGINIQPYRPSGSTNAERRTRWDLFTTLIHEFMHILDHPNYERTYRLIGGEAGEVLREGMADVMRRDLWDGPGRLQSRLATAEYAPIRRQVEGRDYPYKSSVVHYHPDYREYADARDIVNGRSGQPGVGIENAKVAFFMGHTELLGLGAGTSTSGGASLAGVAMYSSTESAEAEIVVVGTGDTYASIQSRTNASPGGILDASSGTPLSPGAALTVGTRLRVPGIRYVYAIQEDTIGSIARQHGVSVADLVRANNLPATTPDSYRFPTGTRVLIPIHTASP